MENYKLVMREHLNHNGYLFGGNMLKWVDEYAWIAASLDYPECSFVTIAMDKVEFRRSVKEGTILRFVVDKSREGRSSVGYRVKVFCGQHGDHESGLVFTTQVTLVRVDADGHKLPLSMTVLKPGS